jgi:biopolymer transport protein ExbB
MTPAPTSSPRTASPLLAFAVAVAFGLILAPGLPAQDTAVAPVRGEDISLGDLIKEGGWAMWPLGLCSMAVVMLYVYNGMQLTRAKFAPLDLQAAVMEQMQACRVRSAIDISATSPTYLGRMLAHSLPFVDATEPETLGRDHVEDAMADFTVRENRIYMTWIGYFSIVAQVAPMLGLLGTVSGMIGAFNKLRATGGSNPELLAGDISEALVTTAAGLIIAIPAIFGYFFFKNKLNRLVSECHGAEEDMLQASVMAVNADQHMAKVPEGLQVA